MLKVQGLSKTFFPNTANEVKALRNVDLEISEGSFTVIIGTNGSGKSTLLSIIGTLEPPTSGSVLLNGMGPLTLTGAALAAFRRDKIGFVFQEHHLLPQCSVLENVLVPTIALPGGGTKQHAERARMLLDRVGLSERLDHRPAELSGGERQRVALGRALLSGPKALLLDEPLTALDIPLKLRILDFLGQVVRRWGIPVLFITHSQAIVRRTADEVIVMHEGTNIDFGSPEAVLPDHDEFRKNCPVFQSRMPLTETA